eukprot:TRINITY_DN45224_c0_g1_i1.p1 TRINITY_DN45224_c0_g1~~TRINITY_DN45224_c0_g1_i1.p1  ORF type:complete len:377 (-),score=91.72 TRINITY_DN45224_c0_g1_i1:182-1312(-)
MAPKAKAKSKSPTRRQADAISGRSKSPSGSTSATVSIPRKLAPRSAWSPALREAATLRKPIALASGDGVQTVPVVNEDALASLVTSLGMSGKPAAHLKTLGGLCEQLALGGHDAIDFAVERGALQKAVAILPAGGAAATGQDLDLTCAVTEALWYLAADYDQTQLLIKAKGHENILRLTRDLGGQDALVACNNFRLLSNTLYCEDRKSQFWQNADLSFVVEALEWALREEVHLEGGSILSVICDVAALWVQRLAGPAAEDVLKSMLALIPLLLEKMAANREDVVLLQQGCRLLYIIAKGCESWPEDMRAPSLAALLTLREQLQFSQNTEVRAYGGLAFGAVASMPAPPGEPAAPACGGVVNLPGAVPIQGGLSTMD